MPTMTYLTITLQCASHTHTLNKLCLCTIVDHKPLFSPAGPNCQGRPHGKPRRERQAAASVVWRAGDRVRAGHPAQHESSLGHSLLAAGHQTLPETQHARAHDKRPHPPPLCKDGYSCTARRAPAAKTATLSHVPHALRHWVGVRFRSHVRTHKLLRT